MFIVYEETHIKFIRFEIQQQKENFLREKSNSEKERGKGEKKGGKEGRKVFVLDFD